MEADGPQVARGQGGFDGRPAGRTVRGAERFDPAGTSALGEHSVALPEPVGQGAEQRGGEEGHIPGAHHDWRGPRQDGGVDPAEGAQSRTGIGDDPEAGKPGLGVGRVGDEDRGRAEGVVEGLDQPVEDATATDEFQALGPALEARRLAAGEDGSRDQ